MGGAWAQQTVIEPPGTSVALSADGGTLAVGAWFDSSNATGVDGDPTDDSAPDSGAVYVFARTESSWVQQAYIKASNTDAGDLFGFPVALSANGDFLAVGATGEDSSASGVDGDQADDSSDDSGAVYVFARTDGGWAQQAYVKASNTDSGDWFGERVSLSANGDTLAVGVPREASSATGVNGVETDNSSRESGAVYVFARSGSTWAQQAYVKAFNTESKPPKHYWPDSFGWSVALSAGGDTLAVGATSEASSATGVDGDETDNSMPGSGAVYIFTRDDSAWTQEAYVKASNTGFMDWFGVSVALSESGNFLAVGANGESSSATGVDGDQSDDSARNSGAVYLFTRGDGGWVQQAYVKASNTDPDDWFGDDVALSASGDTLTVGASREASSAVGVDGDQADNSAPLSGAVYVFH
jgi:hypothetical protein